jgi:hypothetical protein
VWWYQAHNEGMEISKKCLLGGFFLVFVSSCAPKKIVVSFKTPEETFQTWRAAAERLDYTTLLQCYAAEAVSEIRKEIETTSGEGLRSMQQETRKTDFKLEKVVYENDRAYVRVTRRIRDAEEIEILTMVQEGKDWKLIP